MGPGPSTNWVKTKVSECPLGKVTAIMGVPLADLSLINEKLGVLTVADVAKAKREKDNDNSLIVAQVLVMLTQNYSYFIGEVKGNLNKSNAQK